MRLSSAWLVLAVVCTLGGVAHAQVDAGTSGTTGSLPNGATLSFRREFLHEVTQPLPSPSPTNTSGALQQPLKVPDSLWQYFNYAHCVCDEPGDAYGDPNNRGTQYLQTPDDGGANQTPGSFLHGSGNPNGPAPFVTGTDLSGFEDVFNFEIGYTRGSSPDHLPLHIFTGDDQCTNMLEIDTHCVDVNDISDLDTISTTGTITPQVHIYDLMMPEQAERNPNMLTPPQFAQCTQRSFAANEWLAVDTQLSGTLDYFQNQSINTDSLPPPIPTLLNAQPAENAIELTWNTPVGDLSDIYVYQALCLADDNTSAHTNPSSGPYYQTPRTLCGVTDRDMPFSTADGVTADQGGSNNVSGGLIGSGTLFLDAGIDSSIDAGSGFTVMPDAAINVGVPERIAEADPALLCGTNTNSTATSMRIENLANGSHYRIALLVIDRAGNANAIYYNEDPNNALVPRAVTDIWGEIHDRGSQVEGGFCLVAETFGDDSWLTGAMRGFRDDNLAHSAIGRAVIRAYYATLAKLGSFVHGSYLLRGLAALLLSPLIAVALLWHALTLPGLLAVVVVMWLLKRNRRRILSNRTRAIATAAGATAVALAMPHAAHAQPVPNWDGSDDSAPAPPPPDPSADPMSGSASTTFDQQAQAHGFDDQEAREPIPSRSEFDTTEAEAEGPSRPNWIVGARIGPYVPQIDSQFASRPGVPGPYAEMFGTGIELLPMVDVDRVLWRNDYGQLAVGISAGYMAQTANAFLKNSSPSDPMRPRSAGDTNSFHLLPVAAQASYHFTYFDDTYGVPIVPYVRGGLSYYVWWMNSPSGSISVVCDNGGTPPNCMENRAEGASLGFQASIGFQVFAEQIDKTAAKAMHDSGLDHAGFYAELSYANVNGFGEATKLDVGDATWFAGVTFEF